MPTARRPHLPACLAAALAAVLLPSLALAGTASLQGDFSADDELFVHTLDLTLADTMTVATLGYAGGHLADGQTVAAGGFAPVLSLFDGDGTLLQLAVGSSNGCAGAAADPASGFRWDACFSAALGPGHYTLVLSQDGNTPFGPALADGFTMSGQPDYTGQWFLGQSGHSFINADGTQRSGHWALDITAAAVPEPRPWALGLAGLGLLALRRRPL